MSDAKTVRLFPTRDATVPGVPAVVMDVTASQAKRLLAYTPPAFTDTQPADTSHLAQFRALDKDGQPDPAGHFITEDFTGQIDALVPPPAKADKPEAATPPETKEQ